MSDNKDTHHRHSIRLKNYDYREVGYCFVTLCVQDREHLYEAGKMVQRWFFELENKY